MRFALLALVACSLTANAYFLFHRATPPAPPITHNPSPLTSRTDGAPSLPTDPAELHAHLEKLGLPSSLIAQIQGLNALNTVIARMAKLEPPRDPGTPYWKTKKSPPETPEQRLEQRKLWREFETALLQLMNNNAVGPLSFFRGRNERYDFLPEEKRAALKRIEDDYRELTETISTEIGAFPLKSDTEKLKFLDAEKFRDIDALLTPEEKLTLARRSSPAAINVRNRYGAVISSEEEFLALYELQKKFETTYPGLRSNYDKATYAAAEKQHRAEMDALIGPERLAATYNAEKPKADPDLRLLEAAAQRIKLPTNVSATFLDLRAQTATQTQAIASNPNLSSAERTAALKALGEKARAELQQTLGPDAIDTFTQRGAEWIKLLQAGMPYTISPGGIVTPTSNNQ